MKADAPKAVSDNMLRSSWAVFCSSLHPHKHDMRYPCFTSAEEDPSWSSFLWSCSPLGLRGLMKSNPSFIKIQGQGLLIKKEGGGKLVLVNYMAPQELREIQRSGSMGGLRGEAQVATEASGLRPSMEHFKSSSRNRWNTMETTQLDNVDLKYFCCVQAENVENIVDKNRQQTSLTHLLTGSSCQFTWSGSRVWGTGRGRGKQMMKEDRRQQQEGN